MFFKSFGKSSNLLGVGFGVFGVGSGVFGVDPFFICKVMFGRSGVGGVSIFYTTQCLYSIFFVSADNMASESTRLSAMMKRKRSILKRPRGTPFRAFTCKLDTCQGICIHKTPAGKMKIDCVVNKIDLNLKCGSHKKVDFTCDVCLHIFSTRLNSVSNGRWCGMCYNTWKHCGKDGCTFCFKRSFASYTGLTSTGKKKVDCIVNKADLLLPLCCEKKKVDFVCDVCDYIFSMELNSVTTGRWCAMCKNKTELKVYNFLKEINVRVITQYTPGGIKKMQKNYGKFCKMDFYLPDLKLVFEIDGRQHNSHTHLFKNTTLHYRMILDQWKEYLVRKEGMVVVRFDQHAIWRDMYDWKKEISMLCTSEFSTALANKRYKKYAKKHMRGKFRIVPAIVKESYKKYGEPLSVEFVSFE